MIYGANGYTGRLIAEEAANRDLKPVLAGVVLQRSIVGSKTYVNRTLLSVDG